MCMGNVAVFSAIKHNGGVYKQSFFMNMLCVVSVYNTVY